MRGFLLSFLIILLSLPIVLLVSAETAEKLRTQISGNRGEIQKIEQEIKKYKRDLTKIQGEKKTLQNTIYVLDISRKKTNANIRLVENRISKTKNSILSLAEQISQHVSKIKNGSAGLAQAIRRMYEAENESLIEILLKSENVASTWSAVESLRQFQSVVGDRVVALEQEQLNLEDSKDKSEAEKRVLSADKDELSSEKRVLDINRNAKNSLLRMTKNKESEYQKILTQKRKAKEEFEAELFAFETRLKYVLDKNSLPGAGEEALKWPLSTVYITQYFGNTKFANSGAYNGRGHNGIDLRATIGTRVNSAQGGVVVEVGNTDIYNGCYSYGKWILLDHGNGLSTLYAHLSKISVSAGESVVLGQRIGYSGNTGYSTGPHLHLGVYATSGVRVMRMGDVKKRTNCTNARVPIAPTKAYLNPLDYL